MQAKAEFRRSERFVHESIFRLENDQTLSPYYAVSCNLSEAGMYFKSLFEMYPGTHIIIRIDEYTLSQNKVPAKVVWCKKLENSLTFRYGVGVEFLRPEKHLSLKAAPTNSPHMKTPYKKESGVMIRMEKRLPE